VKARRALYRGINPPEHGSNHMENSKSQPDDQDEIAAAVQSAADAAQETLAHAEEHITQTTQDLKAALSSAGEAAQVAMESLREQISQGARATDEAIRRNPYTAAGIALGAGLLVGYLIKRR
jgi:ElaB/YqjD/DUF883 family membrane-anchored ribosome-binding protein